MESCWNEERERNLRGINASKKAYPFHKPASGELTILFILPVYLKMKKFERERKSTSETNKKSMAIILFSKLTFFKLEILSSKDVFK